MNWIARLQDFCRGISARFIGERAGLTHKTVLNLLRGRGTMYSLVRVMEDGLGRDVSQVFEE